jgi:hypothetical protein
MARGISPPGEQGAVMVMVAIALPVLVLFASFAIDVGNWFVHARHLQTQADAGALAAAGDFRYPEEDCSDAEIEKTAREYAGVESGGYNHQVNGGNVEFALNSSSYPGQPSKTDPSPVGGTPCATGKIDVKLAETNLPPFFSVAGIVPFINAHARVQIFKKGFLTGALPLAVPNSNPRSARVEFVDEESGQTLATQKLTHTGTSGGLSVWSNASEPLTLDVNRERIGMRVNLGGGSSSECGQPLVECYELGSNSGLVYVRGYSGEGSGAQPGPPLARDVRFAEEEPLEAGACAYPSFTAEGCAVGLHAVVDFGPCAEIEQVGAKLKAVAGGSAYALERTGACEGSESEWETVGGAVIPIPAEAGPVPVTLEWEETKGKEAGSACKQGGGNKCKGSFGEVQRSYSADELSGPVKLVTLREPGGAPAYSLESCEGCARELVATIGVEQTLPESAGSVDDPLVSLRVTDPNQNQELDCEPETSLRYQLANGCAPRYKRNEGTACPRQKNVLWNETPQPWECVAIETGASEGEIWQGMSERVLGEAHPTTCSAPNNWSQFESPEGIDYANDPRVVSVFLTAFGSFSGNGGDTVPATDFATFYVTGWAATGKSSKEICPGDDEAAKRTIVGHFIKYIQTFNDGSASEEECKLSPEEASSLTPCVAVLTE